MSDAGGGSFPMAFHLRSVHTCSDDVALYRPPFNEQHRWPAVDSQQLNAAAKGTSKGIDTERSHAQQP